MDLLFTHAVLGILTLQGAFVAVQGSAPHFVYQEDWSEHSCGQVLDKVRHRKVDIPLPPDVTGDWVSHRCEIRSGPEYVIRHLRISSDKKFESVVYLYEDPDCHRPLYAVHSKGSHTLQQASWTVRGGTEAEYEIHSSHLIPYTHNATASVSAKLAGSGCHGYLTSGHMVPYKRHLIYSIDPSKPRLLHRDSLKKTKGEKAENSNSEMRDNGASCFQALNFTLNELQLVMVELKQRRLHQHHQHHRQPHNSKRFHHHNHIRTKNSHNHHPERHQNEAMIPDQHLHNDQHVIEQANQLHTSDASSRKESLQLNERANVANSNIDVIVYSHQKTNHDLSIGDPNQASVDRVVKADHNSDHTHRLKEESPAVEVDSSDTSTWPFPNLASRELLLGAVHSRPQEKLTHRPSSFQTALKDARTPGCGVCSRVASATPMFPPRLSARTGTLLSLEGEWASTRCESRQYGMFLTRRLHFLSDGSSWQGQYDYYHDALCKHPSFSLDAKGSYSGGTDSKLIPGAKDYSFKVTRLKVTPHDARTAESMNHYSGNGCGKAHAWEAGKEQDVTSTGGCVTLGIRLPNMERDIMRMEVLHRKLHLYVGQRLIDRKPGTAYQMERPTAFQESLVKCDQHDLDMSINTAPDGHAWVAGIALPLSAGAPEDESNTYFARGGTVGCLYPSKTLLVSAISLLSVLLYRGLSFR